MASRKFTLKNPETGNIQTFSSRNKLRDAARKLKREVNDKGDRNINRQILIQSPRFSQRSKAKSDTAIDRALEKAGFETKTKIVPEFFISSKQKAQEQATQDPKFVDRFGQGISIAPSIAQIEILKAQQLQRSLDSEERKRTVELQTQIPTAQEMSEFKKTQVELAALTKTEERKSLVRTVQDSESGFITGGQAFTQLGLLEAEKRFKDSSIIEKASGFTGLVGFGVAEGGFGVLEFARGIPKDPLGSAAELINIPKQVISAGTRIAKEPISGVASVATSLFIFRKGFEAIPIKVKSRSLTDIIKVKGTRGIRPSVEVSVPDPFINIGSFLKSKGTTPRNLGKLPVTEFIPFEKPVIGERLVPFETNIAEFTNKGKIRKVVKTVRVRDLPEGFDVVDVKSAIKNPEFFDPFFQTLPQRQTVLESGGIDPITTFESRPTLTATRALARQISQKDLGVFGISREKVLSFESIEQVKAIGDFEVGKTGTLSQKPTIQTFLPEFIQDPIVAQFSSIFKDKRGSLRLGIEKPKFFGKGSSRFDFEPFELGKFKSEFNEVFNPLLNPKIKPNININQFNDFGIDFDSSLDDMSGIKPDINIDTQTDVNIDIKSNQELFQEEFTDIFTKQKPIVDIFEDITVDIKTSEKFKIDEGIDNLLLFQPVIEEEIITEPIISPIAEIITNEIIDITEPPPTRLIGIKKIQDFERKVSGFDVVVRDSGRDLMVNETPLPKKAANKLLRDVLDNSLSASGKLLRAKGEKVPITKRSKLARGFDVPISKFRRGKKDKSRLVELRKNRIDSFGEKEGLSAAKLIKQREMEFDLF